MRADVVLFPSKATQVTPDNVLKIVRTEHEHLVSDLVAVAAKRGYAERDRSDIDENGIEIFRKGKLPMTAQTIDFVSANGDATARPPLNEWIGLTLYADYFIQMHLLLPAKKDSKPEDAERLAKQADQIIMLLIQCVKHPAVVPELLELCATYLDHPIDDVGRDAADALLSFSSTPMFNIPLPGEVITPALDEIGERSKDSALDLLRAFVVGSSVVALQHGTVDQSLAEGCRMIGMVRDLLQKQNVNMDSKLLDDLLAAQKEGKAAEFIRARLPKPTK
jgi:flagellar biosynthesis regulator FlbT